MQLINPHIGFTPVHLSDVLLQAYAYRHYGRPDSVKRAMVSNLFFEITSRLHEEVEATNILNEDWEASSHLDLPASLNIFRWLCWGDEEAPRDNRAGDGNRNW